MPWTRVCRDRAGVAASTCCTAPCQAGVRRVRARGGRPMMSTRPPAGIPPVPARTGRRIRARRFILAGLAFLILLAGFEIGIRQVSPDAVQVSAYTVDGGPPFAPHTSTDAPPLAAPAPRTRQPPQALYPP